MYNRASLRLSGRFDSRSAAGTERALFNNWQSIGVGAEAEAPWVLAGTVSAVCAGTGVLPKLRAHTTLVRLVSSDTDRVPSCSRQGARRLESSEFELLV